MCVREREREPVGITRLVLTHTHIPTHAGLTYSSDSRTFWAVSRDPQPSLHEISLPEMRDLRAVALDQDLVPDPEGESCAVILLITHTYTHTNRLKKLLCITPIQNTGVTYVGRGQLAVVCEKTGNVVLVDVGAAIPPDANDGEDMWSAPQVCLCVSTRAIKRY